MGIDRANLRALCVRLTAAPVDVASLAVFRILFGLVMAAAMTRFMAKGWVTELYVAPTLHFGYPGLEWIGPLPAPWMHGCFVLLTVLALGIALGCFYRACTASFFVLFTYVELIDQTAYLNHYYLISLLSGLMILLPANRAWSIDASRNRKLQSRTAPAWGLNLLRLQVGVVYFFAGLAKINSDWLLQAQPLRIWLAARGDLPFVGPLLEAPITAYAASWSGAIFDLTIVFLLLRAKTRWPAYVCLALFHIVTGFLFNIGMFPWIMIAAATLFFPADWPRTVLSGARHRFGRPAPAPSDVLKLSPAAPSSTGLMATHRMRLVGRENLQTPTLATPLRWQVLIPLGLYAAVQLLLPLRPYLGAEPAAWTATGFNCAWQVMIVEKTGFVEFFACDPGSGRRWKVPMRHLLTPRQELFMAQDPHLIRALARRLAAELRAQGSTNVQIKVDAFATLNGRPSQRLIDPDIDLAGPVRSGWILPLKGESAVRSRRGAVPGA